MKQPMKWELLEFPNSRLKLGLPIDPNLAQSIIDNEMQGIANWALLGAARLLKNGKFSASATHDRLMSKWRKQTSSLEEFINESCNLGIGISEKRSDFYRLYTIWCRDNGRKPFAKSRVKELLEVNIGLGITLAEINGYETFKGLQVKQSFKNENISF